MADCRPLSTTIQRTGKHIVVKIVKSKRGAARFSESACDCGKALCAVLFVSVDHRKPWGVDVTQHIFRRKEFFNLGALRAVQVQRCKGRSRSIIFLSGYSIMKLQHYSRFAFKQSDLFLIVRNEQYGGKAALYALGNARFERSVEPL